MFQLHKEAMSSRNRQKESEDKLVLSSVDDEGKTYIQEVKE